MATAPWGGSEALWAETAHRALDAGHDVLISVYGWPNTPAPVAKLVQRGARLHRRKVSRRWRRSGILMWLFQPFRALNEFRPDVVLINQGSTYDISRSKEFTKLRRSLLTKDRWPFVLLCHCEQKVPAKERARRRARDAFRAARFVGLLSQGLRARSERDLGIPLPNARLFQNPLNITATRLLPWPSGETLRFAFVGRIDHVKGLDLAFDVLSTPEWRARPWLLDIYGEGELKDQLVAEAARLGLADRIRFCGFTSEIDSIWQDHHALMLPSRAEGVPNSMLEAMLSGRPVIVSDVGGISEWVRDGDTGYVLPHADAASLKAVMERLWSERASLEQMGRRAYERTIERRDADPGTTLLRWLEEAGRR